MAQVFTVSSTKTALVAATLKVAVQLATGAAVQNRILQIDVTFDGTNAAAVPVLVELVRETGVTSTGGTAPTPVKVNTDASAAAATTARINDTTDGTGPTVIAAWLVPPTSGIVIQFPLGREAGMKVSEFLALRLTAPAVVNYIVNVWFEE